MKYEQYISELKDLTSALQRQPQVIGFSHKFYVPGWVGFVQECLVEHKMNKASKKPIYKGLGYLECGDKISELVKKACETISTEDGFVKNNEDENNLNVLSSAMAALEAWEHVYPETAHWMNIHISDNYITSAYGVIQRNIKDSLSKIVDLPKEKSEKSNGSGEFKAMGNQILAMICNVIVFAVLACLIAGIFG